MRALLGLVLFVFTLAVAAQDKSYYCVADQATGFKLNSVPVSTTRRTALQSGPGTAPQYMNLQAHHYRARQAYNCFGT